jgi:hypothetical protein
MKDEIKREKPKPVIKKVEPKQENALSSALADALKRK